MLAGSSDRPVPEAIQESSFFLDPKDGGGPDNGLGTSLTASQMKQQASFTAWDFLRHSGHLRGQRLPQTQVGRTQNVRKSLN
jgi:hypothetical protein